MINNSVRRLALVAGVTLIGAGSAAAKSPDLQIVGGKYVTKGQYTPTVALRLKLGRQAWCTGTVVADYWILTAKHCVTENKKPEPLGKYFISRGYKDRLEQDAGIERRIDYPSEMDVVLLKSDIKLTSETTKAAPISSEALTEGAVNVLGWGTTDFYNTVIPRYLKVVRMNIEDCGVHKKNYRFCTKSMSQGPRFGDSGGPVFTGRPQYPTLVGINTGGNLPYAFYIKSETIYQWVKDNAK